MVDTNKNSEFALAVANLAAAAMAANPALSMNDAKACAGRQTVVNKLLRLCRWIKFSAWKMAHGMLCYADMFGASLI